jgi:hypothetical protein
MTTRDEKLSTDLGEAADLAVQEHLSTLRLDMPAQEIDATSPTTGEVMSIPNPLWVKMKAFKNKAASDILNIVSRVDPQSMKGRKTDRTRQILDRIHSWTDGKAPTGAKN